MTPILEYPRQHQARHLAELVDLLRLPSISTDPAHDSDTATAADWLAHALRAAGLENLRVIATDRHPLVYADWLHAGPGAPTVLIYGHYDVQPPDPVEKWQTPPFEPEVRDDYLYARGAADDKGQLFIHVKAVEAYLKTVGHLPVNVKFILEGEEEIGSDQLRAFLPANRELLAADLALISDTSMIAPGRPALVYGLRGNCHLLLDVAGPSHDLHSGSYGGGVNNPLNALAHLIARLKNEFGHVTIPGFYDRVRPLSLAERELLAGFPLDEDAWLRETGAPAVWGESEYTLVERLGARPTLDVTGLYGGYTGAGTKTVLPATAHAKISMRLVPDQDPAEIAALFEAYVREILPPSVTAEVRAASLSAAALIDPDTPPMRAASSAYEAAFGVAPVFMREGGSIPIVTDFQKQLGLTSVLMGFGLPDDRIHSPNERFYLPHFYKGIETSIRYLHLLAGAE